MNFWDTWAAQDAPQVQPQVATTGRAWWQDEPQRILEQTPAPRLGEQYVRDQRAQEQNIQAIRKRGHQNISAEEAEQIAEYDLATKTKYQAVCDQCGSGNFILAGTRVAGVVMPTNKCFNCGNSARSPEPALGGGSGSGSIHTRQIDTGGAGGSMFMKFQGVPRGYAPRA